MTNQNNKSWMNVYDNVCMIFFSISDAFTSFGITVMFFYVGQSEVNSKKKGEERKFSLKTRLKYGHSNYKKSEVDDGGNLEKLCEDPLE